MSMESAVSPDKIMQTTSSNPRPHRWLPIIFLVVSTAFSIAPIRNYLRGGSNKDYPLWFSTGRLELRGESPFYKDHNGEFPFMYPPAAATVLAPLSAMGRLPMVAVLVLINTIAWLVCIIAPVYLVAGTIRGHNPLLYWLPSVVCIFYIWSTYLLGGPAVVLAACILGMLICLRHQIWWAAGLLLAFAAGFKAFPILALPYLIYRRHWKSLGFTIAFLIILMLMLPACFRGWHGAMDDVKVWTRATMGSYDSGVIGQRKARSYTWQNGSIIAEAHRLLRPVVADSDDNFVGEPPVIVNITSLSFRQINLVIVGASLLLGLAYLAAMPPQHQRTHWTDAIEGAMLMILIITFTPLSFTYNNAWLMLPIVVVLHFIFNPATSPRDRRLAIAWLTFSLCLLIFTIGKPLSFRIPRIRQHILVLHVPLRRVGLDHVQSSPPPDSFLR